MCTKNLSYFLSGSVVRGFGRGSKALGIPTGKIICLNFYLMNSEILKLEEVINLKLFKDNLELYLYVTRKYNFILYMLIGANI